MRPAKLFILLLALMPLLEGCPLSQSSTSAPGNTNNNGSDDQALVELLQQINVQAATQWTVIGNGYIGFFNANYAALLAYPNGNCAQRSYLFARWTMQQMGLRARRMGLFAIDGRNDIMVEVDLPDKTYLFVPSAGVYFPHSLGDLKDDPSLAMDYIGTPLNGGQLYLDPTFFGTLNDVEVHESLNDSEYDYSFAATATGTNLFGSPNGAAAAVDGDQATYAAGLSGKLPQTISLSWPSPVDAYRVWIDWYDSKNFSSDFDLVLHLADGTSKTMHITQLPVSNMPATEVVLLKRLR